MACLAPPAKEFGATSAGVAGANSLIIWPLAVSQAPMMLLHVRASCYWSLSECLGMDIPVRPTLGPLRPEADKVGRDTECRPDQRRYSQPELLVLMTTEPLLLAYHQRLPHNKLRPNLINQISITAQRKLISPPSILSTEWNSVEGR